MIRSIRNQTLCTTVIATALFSLLVWACIDPMLDFLNADPQVAGFFKDYYGIMLLDYLFVGWFGWGVSGIAAASLIAALITLALILYFFIKKSKVY